MRKARYLVASATLALALLAGGTASAVVLPCNGGVVTPPPGGCVAGFPLQLVPAGPGTASPIHGHPVIADLGLKAGHKQFVFATQAGKLWAVNDDGTIPTGFPITLPGGAALVGGPAVGDVDGDGRLDIVVGWGTLPPQSAPGGFGAYKNNGPGAPFTLLWQHATLDKVGPDGVNDGVISTPAIGDLDGDGHNEVVVGALDEHIYVVDGRNGVDGPSGSPLSPAWPAWVGDTIFSSPALADLDGDGKLEVIIGVDAHFQNGGQPIGVIVPNVSPDGGFLIVLNSNGLFLPGFPLHFDQVIASAPVVGDIDGDGRPEIVFGTGSFFNVPSHKVYAVHCDGTTVAGWPVSVIGQVSTSPALGDLDGDGIADVVVTDANFDVNPPTFHVYAFKGTGTPLWGANGKVPTGHFGESLSAGDPVIADVLAGGPGSGKEVLVPENAEIVVFDAAGTQLTGPGKPSFYVSTTVTGVAVDVSGGVVEIMTNSGDTANTTVAAWRGSGSTTQVPWGMFHRDPSSQGRTLNPGTCAPRAAVATRLHTLTPCRVIDTRGPLNALGGPALAPNATRNFNVAGVCGILASAVAISANLTVTTVGTNGELVVFPADVLKPNASAISFRLKTRANNALVYLSATTTTFSVFNNSTRPVDFILDVNGYFQ